jgi:hypothetical protein
MAGAATIGALRVVLGADTALYEKGLKDASASLSAFGARFKTAGMVIGAAMTALVGGVGLSVKSTIEEADKLSKMSAKIGVPTDQLSALKHAADLSDVSIESLEKGLGRLSRNLIEAGQGSQTPIRAFAALGIGIKNADGSFKTIGQVLPEVADKFKRMRDGPEKTALAMQLLGRAGADLIPMLNDGSAGLREAAEEAKQLGLVISTDTGKAAEAFNDNLRRLQLVLTGVSTQLMSNIIPTLAQFSQFLIDGAKSSGFLQAATDALTTAFNAIARTAIVVYDNIGLIVKIGAVFVGAQIGAAAISFGLAFVKLAAAIRATGVALALFEAIRGVSTRGILLIAGIVALAAGAFDNFSEKIKGIGNWISQILPEGVGEKATKLLESLGLNLNGLTADLKSWQGTAGKDGGGLFNPNIVNATKSALDSFINSTQKRIAAMQAEANSIGRSTYETEKEKIALEASAIAKSNHITVTAALQKKIDDLAKSYASMADKIEGKRIWESTRTAAEQFGITMEDLNGKLSRGSISWDTYNRAVVQAQQKLVQADPIAQGIGQTLENTFDKAIQGGTKFSDLCAQLGRDLLRLMANQAFKMLLMGSGGQQGLLGGLIGGIAGAFSGGGGGVLAGAKALGQGGIGHNALGTKNWKGGLTWVGERGPEIVDLPRGARVHPNNVAEAMSGDTSIVNNFTLSGDVSQATIDRLERMSLTNARAIAKTNQSISSASRFQRTGVM